MSAQLADQRKRSNHGKKPPLRHKSATTPARASNAGTLPIAAAHALGNPSESTFTFSEDDLIPSVTGSSTGKATVEPHLDQTNHYNPDPELVYSKLEEDDIDRKITVQRTLFLSKQQEERGSSPEPSNSDTGPAEESKKPRLSRTLTAISRRPRPSLTPSPARKQESTQGNNEKEKEGFRGSKLARARSKRQTPVDCEENEDGDDEKRRPGLLSRKSSRYSKKSRLSGKRFEIGDDSATPPSGSPTKRPTTPVLRSFSNMSLSSLAKPDFSVPNVPPLPRSFSEKFQSKPNSPSRKRKDELHDVLRGLESDVHKFDSKNVSSKLGLVRSTLQPFLHNYADHPSNYSMRVEHLERRYKILDKWWKALLNIVDGPNGTTINGLDRVTVLDAISGIMERPEWRPLSFRKPPIASSEILGGSDAESSQKEQGAGTQFLLESTCHNARNAFVDNLSRQVAFVVDKLSARSAPASLVSFCSKCCAYGFFFCPGLPDILVRLWRVSSTLLRRLLDASGMPRKLKNPDSYATYLSKFPQSTHSLSFRSLRQLSEDLRRKPVRPVQFDQIQWDNTYWMNRWTGKESDLFYGFAKQYHLLLSEFLPDSAPRDVRMCSPGFLLVQGQILSNLDSTIHRFRKGEADAVTPAFSPTFDDMLGSDGSMMAMSSMLPNASRLMRENRLIMLSREFLSPKMVSPHPNASCLFAECLCEVMKAAASSISSFDQNACFMLCDFLEEALCILAKFEQNSSSDVPLVHLDFWIDVFSRMVGNYNSMIAMRLFAFLFSVWPQLTHNTKWKRELCYRVILDPKIFHAHFNHWNPMVRTYFMRLLAWRLARYDGDATDDDLRIYETLFYRIKNVWAHYKQHERTCQATNKNLPSTAPCNPAPSRRLLIIRTDNLATSNLLSFNSPFSADSSRSSSSEKDESNNINGTSKSFSATQLIDRLSSSLEFGFDQSKKSSFFRAFTGSKPNDNRQTPAKSPPGSPPRGGAADSTEDKNPNEPHRTSLYEQRPPGNALRATRGAKRKSTGTEQGMIPPEGSAPSRAVFKFSLELIDKKANQLPGEMTLIPPRLPLASYLLLQSDPSFEDDMAPTAPDSFSADSIRYTGHALAEWTLVVNECQNFFERRKKEGVPASKFVETPTLGVEPFRRMS